MGFFEIGAHDVGVLKWRKLILNSGRCRHQYEEKPSKPEVMVDEQAEYVKQTTLGQEYDWLESKRP